MAGEAQAVNGIPGPHEVLLPAGPTVDVEGVAPPLMTFAVQLAYVHWLLFGEPLVITSGKDGEHVPGSLHPEGRALDFRTHDKSADEMILFLCVLAYAAPRNNCRVFDERVGAGGEHVHVEFHG